MSAVGYSARWRNHLIQHPRPLMIRCYIGDDATDIDVPADVNWSRMAETVDSLDPDRIECWSDNGTLIRGMKRPEMRARQGGVAMPASLHADPHAAMVMLFANLLHRAYEHSTQVAFDKVAEIVQYQGSNNEKLTGDLTALRQENDELRQQVAEMVAASGGADEGGGVDGIVSAFMNGMSQAKSEAS